MLEVDTTEQLADVFTKGLAQYQFEKFVWDGKRLVDSDSYQMDILLTTSQHE